MAASNGNEQNPDRLGKMISTIFIACLAAFFLFTPHFLFGTIG